MRVLGSRQKQLENKKSCAADAQKSCAHSQQRYALKPQASMKHLVCFLKDISKILSTREACIPRGQVPHILISFHL